jgi:hypothetical protein
MASAKHGTWTVTDVAEREDLLAFIRARAVPLSEVRDAGFGTVYCQGAAIDLARRRFRCYPCREPLVEVDRDVRAAPAWTGWDAGLAVGGREEFADTMPEAARVVEPYRMRPAPPVVAAHDAEWFAGWDPATGALTVRDDPASADWYLYGWDVVTIITPERAGFDYRVDCPDVGPVHPLLVWLRAGPPGLEPLLATTPFPPPDGPGTRSGAVIDQELRLIWYWLTAFAPARLLRAVHDAWPGWRVQAIRDGLAEHFAVTGRGDSERVLRWPRVQVIG